MKLAFTTLACPRWTLEQAIEAAQRYGYEGLELRLLDGELLRPDLDSETRQRVRKACQEASLPIICVDTSVKIAQPDPAIRAQQVQEGLSMLELAADWESPLVRVFAGPPTGTPEPVALAAAVECLTPLAERGQRLGVAVSLETHDAFCRSPAVMHVLGQVAGAGALWDTLHPYRMGEAIDETLNRLRSRLLHVHIKDGRPAAGGGSDWEQTLLGAGAVPIQAIMSGLQRAGYTGWLAVEWEKKWHPELAEPEVALPQHAEVLRQLLAATIGSTIQERLSWPITPELYQKIRRLWISHSIAEDARDLQGLIDTLAEDCVYLLVPTGQRWEGHAGARAFYTSFLRAFPDVKFNMSDIVIGPQGVIEVAELTGRHLGPWAGMEPTGKPVKFTVIIHFPWNPVAQKFAGENVYFDRAALTEQLA